MVERARIKAVVLLLAVGLSLGIGELALRIAGVEEPRFHRVDARRGWSLAPGAEGWWGEEGGAYVRINADGMRDRERPREKPAGAFRIAVLGDSFAAAFQLPLEKTFWFLLERELGRCPSLSERAREVLNFGVNNYGTAHELLTLRHHALAYDPDLVLLAAFTGNDVYNNSKALTGGGDGPYFEVEGGRLVLDASFRDGWRYRFRSSPVGAIYDATLSRSRVVQVAARAWSGLRSARARRTHAAAGAEAGISRAIYAAPADPRWREAWAVTERLLRAVDEEARGSGARLLVVTLSNPEQVHPDAEARESLRRSLGVEDLLYPDRRIARAGRRDGYEVLNLAPPMQRHADLTGAFLHGFANEGLGHWNETGHALAAELIAAKVCAMTGDS